MIPSHINHLRLRGFSPSTLKNTAGYLTRYSAWLWDNTGKKIREASEEDLERYSLRLKESHTPASAALMLRCIKKFYRFLHGRGHILKDPAINLSVPRKEQRLRDVPEESEVDCLLSRPDCHTYHGIRDRAILEVLYGSGLRNMEVRNLNIQDVDLKESEVKVIMGKGGKDRTVPLSAKAVQAIAKYLEVTRPKYLKYPQEDRLFLSERGRPFDKLCINEIFQRYRNKSNLTTAIAPHHLRHACALHMLRGGAPVTAVQEMLGHKRLSTTQIYTRLQIKDLKDVHRRFHPRERSSKLS